MTPPPSPFVQEMRRLLAAFTAAKKRNDPDAIKDAADDMVLLFRFNATGRLQEYAAARAAAAGAQAHGHERR